MRFVHELQEGNQFRLSIMNNKPSIAVSSDGGRIAYSTTEGIFLRSVDELEANLIPGSGKNSQNLFFSPDGQWIGYDSATEHKLKKIAVTGGTPVSLCDVGIGMVGAHWYTKDEIVFCYYPGGMARISAAGGTPEMIKSVLDDYTIESGVMAMPQVLPDGKTILYTETQGLSDPNVKTMIRVPETGEVKQLSVVGVAGARYFPTGHILYESGDTLFALPFDPERGEITGGAVPVLEGIQTWSISESGTLAYVPLSNTPGTGTAAESGPERTLWWVDRSGREERIEAPARHYQYPKISPDGKKIALNAAVGGNDDIWVLDLLRGNLPRLTFNESNDMMPLWSPDGLRIAYSAVNQETMEAGGFMGVFCKSADGTGKTEFLGISPGKVLLTYSWSGDGETILVVELDTADLKGDIGMISTDGDRSYRPLLNEDYVEVHPQLSPDGRWLAYCANESGGTGSQVYVRAFPDVNSGGRWLVSTDSGSGSACPLWSPDGKELFYLLCKDNGRVAKAVIAVPVETEPTFNPGKPKVLFEGEFVGTMPAEGIPYDIHPDGKRFLMMKQPAGAAETSAETAPASIRTQRIVIVTNWFEELKKKVPVE
jgi:serine/threonine-protein kinase